MDTFSSDDGGTETGTPGGEGSGSSVAADDNFMRGTFVFRDGSEMDLDVPAHYRRSEFGDAVQHSCEGSDAETGLILGVSWRDGTTVGTHTPSLADGPGFFAAWNQAEGGGVRATLPSAGELSFVSVGIQPGDLGEGTARALLYPDDDDPNDLVSEIVEIEFRCMVEEDE